MSVKLSNAKRKVEGIGIAAAALLFALFGQPTHANDTTAVLGAGGLIFTQSGTVSMVREDLYLSPSRVEVNYTFRNTAATPVTTIVAFPMPKIGGRLESMSDVPDVESDNFMGFTVVQDGQPIATKLQQRVTVQGIDFTDEVASKNVPLQPLSEKTRQAVVDLDPSVQQDWLNKGLLIDMAYDPEGKATPEYYPVWELESVYWWETTFPAGEEVEVEHSYRPSVGGTVAMVFIQDGKPNDNYADYKKRYCIDDDFMALAARLEKQQNPDAGVYFFEKWLSYILTTGSNWYGPIETFHLTVDKGSEKNFVSFCGTDVRKTGPTTFEMTAKDFYPEKDLDILLVVPSEP